jgi:hypothetical protein
MTSPLIKPSYTVLRVDGLDSALPSDTNSEVELRLLHDKKNVEKHRDNTGDTHSKRRPALVQLQGPAALLSIVLLTGAAVGVLLASRGSPIERWEVQSVQIQPQVWLSVLSTIMDGLTMFAAAKAAEITFWRTAAHGTTLRSLYDLYESQSILGALKNLCRLRGDRLAFVSVLCLVSALRGPLFQRASTIDSNAMRNIIGKQELKVAQLIPPNFLFSGSVGDRLLFDAVYNAYVERAPIHMNTTNRREECGDHCDGKVKVCTPPSRAIVIKLIRIRATVSISSVQMYLLFRGTTHPTVPSNKCTKIPETNLGVLYQFSIARPVCQAESLNCHSMARTRQLVRPR